MEGGQDKHIEGAGDASNGGGETNGNPLLGNNPLAGGGGWIAGLESCQDLLGVELTEADRRLIAVYGNIIQLNDGHHLHGGINTDMDAKHTLWFGRVIAHPHRLYFPPCCKVGKRSVSMFVGLLCRAIDQSSV